MGSLVNETGTLSGTTDFNAVNQQLIRFLINLQSDTTYYYQVVAMNSEGMNASQLLNVTTLPSRESMYM